MTPQEAIKRIEKFGLHHAIKDLPYSAHTVEAFEMAVEALGKQIPKKPVEGYVFREEFREYLLSKKKHSLANTQGSCCPSCGKHIGVDETILKRPNGYPFCEWCGQAIEWGQNE